MGFFDRGKGPTARASSAREINNGRPDAGTDREIDSAGRGKPQPKDSYSKTPNKPPPPGGGKVWDYTNEEWADMPNLNPRRPWSRTGADGTRTGDPNERLWHEPGSASGNWSPTYYHWDENGNWVPKPDGKYGMPENDDGTPIYTPDPIKYPEYFVSDSPEKAAAWEEMHAKDVARDKAIKEEIMNSPEMRALMSSPDYQRANASGQRRMQGDIFTRARKDAAKKRTMEKFGMSEETYDNRFKTSWPVPRSRNGEYWYRPPGARGPDDPGVRGPTPPNVAGGGGGNDAANTPSSGRELNDWMRATETPKSGGRGGMIEGYQGSSGASTGQSDVLAALSRLQGLPIGAPTAATNAPGGFARAASPIPPAVAMAGAGAPKKPTIVRRGGGVVSRA